jgi:hypothetical protein
MLSHFVRKDARNWDEYVPNAVMAYREMPHCSTKYSPYHLAYGRDMRLPIEKDWKPQLGEENAEGNEYEAHVNVLTERLHEANKVVGAQSKQSHETAKRYYDRKTKLEQFKRGNFVYVHDPIHKCGKARKFSYQYKGPYEIEENISSLIYKVRLENGASVMLRINRLKKAFEQAEKDNVLPLNGSSKKTIKSGRTRKLAPRENKVETKMLTAENPPRPPVLD